jgi:hypothetical protein
LSLLGATSYLNPIFGYNSQDLNLDGMVIYSGSGSDRQVILSTLGATTYLNPMFEQLP